MPIDNEGDEDISGTEENDEELDEDMEDLRKACMLAGTSFDDAKKENKRLQYDDVGEGGDLESGSEEDDLELLRNVKSRFSNLEESYEAISLEPLCTLPPVLDDDEDDDFETLCAVRRRFACYNNDGSENFSKDAGRRVNESSVVSEIEASDDSMVDRQVACEVVPEPVEVAEMSDGLTDNLAIEPFVESHGSDTCKLSDFVTNFSSFPNSAKLLLEAIKKNRSYQRFLRSKLTQIEARMEENKKLRERVKILKDFQARCKKVTGRAFSQEKDPRIQLISARRTLPAKYAKLNDKTVTGRYSGPLENSHVANYRLALSHFPLSWKQKPWSKAERENLEKGLRQQFQEMVLQVSVDQLSESEGSCGDTSNLDGILASIRDLEIGPERIREFIPKVNWDQLASLYVPSRSGAECEARWLNFEDPLINRSPWTSQEDKKILFIVQEKGITNWFDIASSLGTNRTPFQCLARFQRSLNARILRREWTEDEDCQLRAAVETYGEGAWQTVASTLVGRTGSQCSNRWMKSLHPDRSRTGRWTLDEDKRLKVAVKLFGPKNWKRIAYFVPGRTQVQCRERWANKHDPSLNFGEWTEEEDLRLRVAIEENGYCWSKIAECLPGRNDNQCLRRWKLLFPDELALHQASRRTQKAALISNFVDREEDRPALGPCDFVPLQMIASPTEPKNMVQAKKCKRKSREQDCTTAKGKNAEAEVPPRNALEKLRPRRCSKSIQGSSEKARCQTGGADIENTGGNFVDVSNTLSMPCLERNKLEKLPKQIVKQRKLFVTENDSQSLLLPLESFGSMLIGSDSQQNCGGDNAFDSGTTVDGAVLVDSRMGPDPLALTLNKDDLRRGRLDASFTDGDLQFQSKMKASTQSRNKVEQEALPDDGSEVRLMRSGNIENSALNETCLIDEMVHAHRRKGGMKPRARDSISVLSQPHKDKKSQPKSKFPREELGTQVEDDITLATLVCCKARKKRPSIAKSAGQNSLSCTRAEQLSAEPGTKKVVVEDGEAQTCNDSIPQITPSHDMSAHHLPDNAQEVSMVHLVNCRGLDFEEQASEVVTSHDHNLDDNDITLKSFLRRRRKRNV